MKRTSVGKSAVAKKKAAIKEKTTISKSASKPSRMIDTEPKVTRVANQLPTVEKATVTEKGLGFAEMENFKGKLLVLRSRLRGNVITMTDAALNKNRMEAIGDLSTMPIHMADIGSDNFEQEQTLSFMQSEHGLLEMVDEALARIKEGIYGICENCECRIPKARLNALPYAAKCVRCAASDEQH